MRHQADAGGRQSAGKRIPARGPGRIEWPTLGVAAAVYAGFALLTWQHQALPSWLLAALGGYVVAWHGSLQHEVVHGHPTPWRRVNELLVFPSLWLWLPFALYRETHLLHHRSDHLTHPGADPESYYMARDDWERCGRLRRMLLCAHNTSLGRLLIGPFVAVASLAVRELGRARATRCGSRIWLVHALACASVLSWVVGVCGMGLGEYLLLFVYPGLSLTLLRSFVEHRARPLVGERSAVVEAGRLMSLLFLNNNLHALHHAEPWLAWYRLPARYRQRRAELLAANGGYWYPGFANVVCRHLLHPKEPVVHPLT